MSKKRNRNGGRWRCVALLVATLSCVTLASPVTADAGAQEVSSTSNPPVSCTSLGSLSKRTVGSTVSLTAKLQRFSVTVTSSVEQTTGQKVAHPSLERSTVDGTNSGWSQILSPTGFFLGGIGSFTGKLPTDFGAGGGNLCIVNFPGHEGPIALLAVATGPQGPDVELEAFPIGGGYPPFTIDLGDAQPAVAVTNGVPVIATKDANFFFRFDDFANSGLPVEVLSPVLGATVRFAVVTSNYLGYLNENAQQLWSIRGQLPRGSSQFGIVSAWAADQCLLGKCSSAMQKIRHLASEGALTFPHNYGNFGSVTSYLRALQVFLAQQGYAKS